MAKRIRVRSKRLDEIDETKLSLAIWLIAKSLVEDKTTPPKEPSAPEVEAPETANDEKAA